jgi:hypothetical protein
LVSALLLCQGCQHQTLGGAAAAGGVDECFAESGGSIREVMLLEQEVA